jgi:tight adherence protein B
MFLVVFVFILGVGAVLGAYAAVTYLPGMLDARRLERRLKDVSTSPDVDEDLGVVRRLKQGPLPALDRLVSGMRAGSWLAALIEQSGVRTTPSALVIMTLAAAAAAGFAGAIIVHQWFAPPVAAVLGSLGPLGFLMNRKAARMRAFEEQFPEALDLLSRAMRAGHSFTTGIEMVGTEMPDPIGPEFRTLYDQQNYGMPLPDALKLFAERIPVLDARFFVTAVLIQRESGGNLSEVLDNLAKVIRERFRVKRQIRVISAHGRITGWILVCVPPALALVLFSINPETRELMFYDPLGQRMIIGAVVMEIIGAFVIRKIINVEY